MRENTRQGNELYYLDSISWLLIKAWMIVAVASQKIEGLRCFNIFCLFLLNNVSFFTGKQVLIHILLLKFEVVCVKENWVNTKLTWPTLPPSGKKELKLIFKESTKQIFVSNFQTKGCHLKTWNDCRIVKISFCKTNVNVNNFLADWRVPCLWGRERWLWEMWSSWVSTMERSDFDFDEDEDLDYESHLCFSQHWFQAF